MKPNLICRWMPENDRLVAVWVRDDCAPQLDTVRASRHQAPSARLAA